MQPNTYPKPPIVEAIIDFQTTFSSFDLKRFEIFRAEILEEFPVSSSLQQVQLGFSLGNVGENNLQEIREVGQRLTSRNSDRVLQVQQRGFTFSHMPPYSRWEDFRDEAKTLWSKFQKICGPENINRFAVRFINRITIPKPSIELPDYFNLYPNIPTGIPQDTSGVFMQLQMPQPDLEIDAQSVINFALAEPERPNHTTLLLDFDLFAVRELNPETEDVWIMLEKFRTRKNELFEACITDETRKLFQ